MYLRTLVVNGFKSFAEAKIDFPNGITAVVGPNGTGKSNIVDAILWAMGEQSVKSLRSERMEDVIFNGTEQRKPMGMVEASLIFSEVAPRELEPVSALLEGLDQVSDVMITRRLYREGDSEYYFNKIPCRLKDIRGFLWNARAGARGQSVIEQGNIEQLLSASPQERREFIEGTAGIIRYKKQKAEALRKLQSTENNLLRVRDILGEVRHQLRTLNRQAKQAEEYQSLLREARELEVQLLTYDFRRFFQEQCLFEKELHESESQEMACLAEEARLVAEQQEVQLELASTSETLKEAQDRFREIEQRMSQAFTAIQIERNRLDQYEQQHEQVMAERTRLNGEGQEATGSLEVLRDRLSQIRCEMEALSVTLEEGEGSMADLVVRRRDTAEKVDKGRETILALAVEKTNLENRLQSIAEGQSSMARRIERLAAEFTQSQTDQTKLQAEGETLRQQRSTLESQLEGLRTNQERLEVSLQSQRETREELDGKILELQTQTAGSESELRAIQSVFREELGYGHRGEGDEASIRVACSSIQEAMAERMEVPEEVEKAIEAVLGEQLQAWIVQSAQEAEMAIEQFKRHEWGKGSFIPLSVPRAGKGVPAEWWSVLQHDPEVRGLALDFVQVPDDLRRVVDALLGNTVIVKSLSGALNIMSTHSWFQGNGPLLVTLGGELVSPSGVIIGGSGGEAGGLLHRRREILTLEEKLKTLTVDLEEAKANRKNLIQEIEQVSTQLEEATVAIREMEFHMLTIQKEAVSKEQALPDLLRRLDILQQDRLTEEAEWGRLQVEEVEVRTRLEHLNQTRAQEDGALRHWLDSLNELDRERQDLSQSLNDTRMNYQTLKTQWDHEQGNIERIEREEENRKIRIQQIDQQLEHLFLQSRKSQEERLRNEGLVEELDLQKETIAGELLEIQNRHAGLMEGVKRLDGLIGRAREALSQIFKSRVPIEGRLAEVRTKLHAVQETLTMTYEISTEDLKIRQDAGNNLEVSEHGEHVPVDVAPDQWREQLQGIRKKLERIGPINLAAIEEHAQLEERYQFLLAQEEDLAGSIHSLQEIIQRLNQTTNKLFAETFKELQVKFNEVFSALFAGGRAELILVEDTQEGQESEAPNLEPGVEIVAQPPGKRLKNLSMLSGGEKTMTVMALLFASFLIRPSPFCVLDEVDAPLDETNVVRFGQFLRQMADRSQFIVITHNKRTMEVANSLFGVTMEDPGVSKLIAVRLHELEEVG
ncbi:MAG: chromosome segregation protein SMC [Nitrospirota bacterium]|nr:chromosome segregation protein SMC [Nitrospirota bacterium]